MTVVITPRYDGSHGYDVVGPFETPEQATAWLSGREGILKPLTSPEAHMALREETDKTEEEE